jgi:hypothetical protein
VPSGLSIPEPMTEDQVKRMRQLIASEAHRGAFFTSLDLCSFYVRRAIERAHKKTTCRELKIQRKSCASEYGDSLLRSGFGVVKEKSLEPGDIVIFEAAPTSPYGHIQVYTGTHWVSDYKQDSIFPDHTYTNLARVHYRFYGVTSSQADV